MEQHGAVRPPDQAGPEQSACSCGLCKKEWASKNTNMASLVHSSFPQPGLCRWADLANSAQNLKNANVIGRGLGGSFWNLAWSLGGWLWSAFGSSKQSSISRKSGNTRKVHQGARHSGAILNKDSQPQKRNNNVDTIRVSYPRSRGPCRPSRKHFVSASGPHNDLEQCSNVAFMLLPTWRLRGLSFLWKLVFVCFCLREHGETTKAVETQQLRRRHPRGLRGQMVTPFREPLPGPRVLGKNHIFKSIFPLEYYFQLQGI